MKTNKLEVGMRVLQDNVGQAKTIHEIIEDADTYEFIVLFTDNTYVIVPPDFVWEVFA